MDILPSSPILLFDSGLGGLSVLEEVRKAVPDAPIIYAADTAGLPYGEKTEAEIAARVAGLLGRMSERYAPRLICIACNTASTIALGMVRSVLQVPIVGTVPAIKPAAVITRTGTIGLLGTAATIRQSYVDDLEAQFAADKRLIRYAAPELVGAAETKLRGGRPDDAVFAKAVAGLRTQAGGEAIDTVVLACTHFPLLADELRAAMGPDISFVHGAEGIARRIRSLTIGQEFGRDRDDSAIVTGPVDPALSAAVFSYGLRTVASL
ncbi:glutamate racemase [Aurantiacibacter marinus]|uniref:Glutamate racemase n=1 Tax=Aurantiacibacter marinus TaxID=874156 RepID=A0A0H0XSU6_9SPHN|nr:glutamate racemase [Aurantiacibacter marinus]KLI63350.1 glutamate racemase [Aurantiacibacter marinus]